MKNPLLQYRNLEEILKVVGGPVKLLRGSRIGPYAFLVNAPEHTNWRDEQRTWKEGVALLNLSYHMTDLYLRGPDALEILRKIELTKMQIGVRTPQGERIRRTTETADKALAREFHDRIKVELWRIDKLDVKPERTWNDAVVRWLKENDHKATAGEDVSNTYLGADSALPVRSNPSAASVSNTKTI